MKARMRTNGDDGTKYYQAGDLCESDSDWLRRMLVNGLAEPLDGDARTLARNPGLIERHRSLPLIAAARELKLEDKDIPAAKEG